MASHPWQMQHHLWWRIRLLFSVFACAVNYRQEMSFVKATNRHRTHAVHEVPIFWGSAPVNGYMMCYLFIRCAKQSVAASPQTK